MRTPAHDTKCDIQDQTVKATEVRDLQAEVQRLRDDNADLRKRNGELTKAGFRVEQLESKVLFIYFSTSLANTRSQMDEMINERVTQKENEMHATYDEKIRNFEERLAMLIGEDVLSI